MDLFFILEESTDSTKPITYGVKQLYDHQRYIFFKINISICVYVYFLL